MPNYRKAGQIDVYKKDGGGSGPIIGIIVLVVMVLVCAGIFSGGDEGNSSDRRSSPPTSSPPPNVSRQPPPQAPAAEKLSSNGLIHIADGPPTWHEIIQITDKTGLYMNFNASWVIPNQDGHKQFRAGGSFYRESPVKFSATAPFNIEIEERDNHAYGRRTITLPAVEVTGWIEAKGNITSHGDGTYQEWPMFTYSRYFDLIVRDGAPVLILTKTKPVGE